MKRAGEARICIDVAGSMLGFNAEVFYDHSTNEWVAVGGTKEFTLENRSRKTAASAVVKLFCKWAEVDLT